jgi:hypothetical protein
LTSDPSHRSIKTKAYRVTRPHGQPHATNGRPILPKRATGPQMNNPKSVGITTLFAPSAYFIADSLSFFFLFSNGADSNLQRHVGTYHRKKTDAP